MGFTMGLNFLLLLAMVATNILSLYHLSSTLQSKPPQPSPTSTLLNQQLNVPDHLLTQLRTIRATITSLTRHHPSTNSKSSSSSSAPSDLLLYSQISPIATSCHSNPNLLHRYMTYTPFANCPADTENIAESLILLGCHPLPRRRCFSLTPSKSATSLTPSLFPTSLPDSAVIWSNYKCKSLSCLQSRSDFVFSKKTFMTYDSDLDLPISQLIQIATSASSVIRLAIDIGGGTGSFAAAMKLYNVTVVTTTMNLGAPYNEVVALRGLAALHMPLQQRLPVFDGVLDLVRCGHAVNRWIPLIAMEFMFYDLDRVLRGGGYLWFDHFFSKGVDLDKVYAPLIGKLGYKKVKWATGKKTDSSGVKNGEVYLTALLQKPVSK